MKINNLIGHPIWCQGTRPYLLQAGESEVPDEVVLEIANTKGQLKEYIDAGLIVMVSAAPMASEADTLDEKPKAKAKK